MKINTTQFERDLLRKVRGFFKKNHILSTRQTRRLDRRIFELTAALERTATEARHTAERNKLNTARAAVTTARRAAVTAARRASKKIA